MLFIDARNVGDLVDRTRKDFSDDDIAQIARIYHSWRGEKDAGEYADIPGFCRSVGLEEIRANGYVLTPGPFVGASALEDQGEEFGEHFKTLKGELSKKMARSDELSALVRKKLEDVIV